MTTETLTTQRRYLTISEAAAYMRVSPATVRRLIDADVLRALRPSPGRVVLDLAVLDEYVQATGE
jgi:excisionase family DNA binding protein